MTQISRRNLLLAGGAAALASLTGSVATAQAPAKRTPLRPCFNPGTFRSFNLPIEEEIDIAAKAGYKSIEPWINKIEQSLEKGNKITDLRKRLDDHGMVAEGLVTFFQWAVDDNTRRAAEIEKMKKDMDIAVQLGASCVAATGSGLDGRVDDFRKLGERYRTILDIGDTFSVRPVLEIWGSARSLNSLSDAIAIATWSGHAKAGLLLDIFHMYRGGSPFEGLALLNGRCLGSCFHVNDYPAEPARERQNDSHRVYCGDGVAPLTTIFQTLRDIGYEGSLSFEVFNPTYWATNDPLLVAKTSLEKLNAVLNKLS